MSGAVSGVAQSAAEIPRVIHQIFFLGEAAVPVHYRQYAATWKKSHPDWDHQFWDADRCRALIEQHYAWFLPVYDGYRHRIQRIDAIRYFILHHHGGVYIDMDIENRRPIDGLTSGRELLVCRSGPGFTNAVMASGPGHELWPHVFDTMVKRRKRFSMTSPLSSKLSMPMQVGYSTGPIMLTHCLRATGYDNEGPTTRVCPSFVFEPLAPGPEALPLQNGQVDLSRSYAVHHMSMHWLPRHHKLLGWALHKVAKLVRPRATQ